MQFAVTRSGERVEATRGLAAVCPICGQSVIAKCGEIRVHHWAHTTETDCDVWYEPETEWHRNWKAQFPAAWTEVPMGEHRADILTGKGLVVELQNSPISVADILARENYYRRMVWIVNAESVADRMFLLKRQGTRNLSFKWKQMKASWQFARKPVYLDFGSYQVRHLLGGRQITQRAMERASGETHLIQDHQLVRWGTGNRAVADASLADLSEELLSCDLLEISTLHPNGFGSVRPIRSAQLRKYLGAIRE